MTVCVCMCVCELLDCMSALSDASPSLLPVCKYIYICRRVYMCVCTRPSLPPVCVYIYIYMCRRVFMCVYVCKILGTTSLKHNISEEERRNRHRSTMKCELPHFFRLLIVIITNIIDVSRLCTKQNQTCMANTPVHDSRAVGLVAKRQLGQRAASVVPE